MFVKNLRTFAYFLVLMGFYCNLFTMGDDPFQVLGVEKGASQEDVKKAYRKKARQLHPDRNGNSPESNEQFATLQRAYDCIMSGNPETFAGPNISPEAGARNPFSAEEIDLAIRSFHNGTMDSKTKKYWKRMHLFDIFEIRPPTEEATQAEKDEYQRIINGLSENLSPLKDRYVAGEQLFEIYRMIYGACYYLKCIFHDTITTLNEIYRIKTLGSSNASAIRRSATINKIFNISSMLLTPIRPFNQYVQNFVSNDEESNIVVAARVANLLPSIAAFKFFGHDRLVSNKAKKIAKYNQKNPIDIKYKKMQAIWLAINKIAPYLGFVYSRIKNDKVSAGQIFSRKSLAESDGTSNNIMMVMRCIANISEIIRKYYLSKLEVDDFKLATKIEKKENKAKLKELSKLSAA